MNDAPLYGIAAEFARAEDLVAVARRLRLNGFHRLDAYTPFAVEELDDILHPPSRPWIPILILLGGMAGAVYSYFIQYWAAVLDYPINVGGRPFNSWPAFVVPSFEVTVLFAVATATFALLLFCRLPRLYHPIFNAPDFDRASQDRFFLSVEASDPYFDVERLRDIFEKHAALNVSVVPA